MSRSARVQLSSPVSPAATLTVLSEPDTPVVLDELFPDLVELGLTVDPLVDDGTKEGFATLELVDGAEVRVDGELVDADEVLRCVAAAVVDALRSAVERVDPAPEERQLGWVDRASAV